MRTHAVVANEPFTFVSGWFRRHGIAYLDMVLMALEKANLQEAELKPGTELVKTEDQHNLARELGYSDSRPKGADLQRFSQVVYLVPRQNKWPTEVRSLLDLVADGKWDRVLSSVERSRPEWDSWKEGFAALKACPFGRRA